MPLAMGASNAAYIPRDGWPVTVILGPHARRTVASTLGESKQCIGKSLYSPSIQHCLNFDRSATHYNSTIWPLAQKEDFAMAENTYDVIICGGGPVGLLLAFQLARLGIPTLIIEQYDKTQQDMYGRASTLYPRTVEMLDQLGLLDEMSQVGFIGKASVTYKDGQRVHDRGWDFISRVTDTYFDYCLNIRQKYSEDIFRSALEQHGGRVNAGWTLKNLVVKDDGDDYRISAKMTDQNGATVTAKSKYIIGADGGRSSVRQLAGIPFVGEKSAFNWIRIDAVIKTDMPDSRIGFGAIESATHGNVLWVALDHGRSRIGFAVPKALHEEYGDNITEEVAKQEAIKAMSPFKIEFVEVEWWTLYSIGQRVADTFQHKDRVLLAGDAAHTHSSGAAQGMVSIGVWNEWFPRRFADL
jgi:phenol 2-monooxygenase